MSVDINGVISVDLSGVMYEWVVYGHFLGGINREMLKITFSVLERKSHV